MPHQATPQGRPPRGIFLGRIPTNFSIMTATPARIPTVPQYRALKSEVGWLIRDFQNY